MRELTLQLPRDDRPIYLRLAEAVRQAIRAARARLGDLRLFPYDEFRGHLNDALKRDALRCTGFSDPAGFQPFLDELAVYLRRVRAVEPGRLVVTHGSQEGLFLAGQLLCGPGDTIG